MMETQASGGHMIDDQPRQYNTFNGNISTHAGDVHSPTNNRGTSYFGVGDSNLPKTRSSPQLQRDISLEELTEQDPFNPDSENTPLISIKHGSRKRYVTTGSLPAVNENEIEINLDPKEEAEPEERTSAIWQILKLAKIVILFLIMFSFTLIYAVYPELQFEWKQLSLSATEQDQIVVNDGLANEPLLQVYLKGEFLDRYPSSDTNNVGVKVINRDTNTTKSWPVVVANPVDQVAESIINHKFDFSDESVSSGFDIYIETTATFSVPVSTFVQMAPKKVNNSVIYAAAILVFVYILIIFELVHRTLAAMMGALMSIAVLAEMNQKPSLELILTWLDYDTLALLFGMMVLVAILSDTGFFDWVALVAYKLAKSKTWPLITILCICCAVISAFLDNVTTILLISPVTIRLCEALNLDPKHVLIAEVMFSNIGGTATAIGDPPNVIILSNPDVAAAGIDFSLFTLHMSIGSVICAAAAYTLLRLMYRRKELLKSSDPPEVAEMKREIEIWKRACNKLMVTTREESTVKALLLQKICSLENSVRSALYEHRQTENADFKMQVSELTKIYKIRDRTLLIKCSVILAVVVCMFFVNSFVPQLYLTVGWIPVLGAIWLLILSDFKDIDGIFQRIEWATLIFFAALFVMMEGLDRLGLIDFITEEVIDLIKGINEESRLAVAIIIILWVSALVSSFIDNIPYTTAMLPVIVKLSEDVDVNLPIQPLVWALAFGACLGGNGTLIGASCNVVAAGIADGHGHGFSFLGFFKVGFPMMLLTTFVAMLYLLICHVAFSWNE